MVITSSLHCYQDTNYLPAAVLHSPKPRQVAE